MRKSVAVVLGLLVAGGAVSAQQYLITTVAGGGVPFTPVPAPSASFGAATSVATDAYRNVYFSAGNWVFKVDPAGVLTRVAGSSAVKDSSGDGGPATSAHLNQPSGVAVDASGNIFIADTHNFRVRRVAAATGTITTVAGNGTAGYSGDGGPATSAQLAFPMGVAVDDSGNLYIADYWNGRIRKVAAATGTITTVAGGSTAGYSGDGGPATSAQLLPAGVAVDGSGNLYIADYGNHAIRKVAAATGIIRTVAGNGTYGYSGDGGPASRAQLGGPSGVAVDAAGNMYIADGDNHLIRKVAAATGIITTVAGVAYTQGYSGDGGRATSAKLAYSQGVAVDGSGNLYIADGSNNVIREVAAATGIITTVAGNGTYDYSGEGGPATSAQLSDPVGVAVDGSGNFYIADSGNNRVHKVAAATGAITTVAGNGAAGYSGDGGPATSAQLHDPVSVAVDGSGNLYIADLVNNVIRRVAAATGIITTVAGNGTNGYSGDGGPATSARLNLRGVAVDGSGNMYIADDNNYVIRKVAAVTGIITTVAGNGSQGYSGDGGLATNAQIGGPQDLAVDGAGNIFIADFWNGAIRKVAAATGTITTVAGYGTGGYSGDGGPATSARLLPQGVAVDGSDNLYISDAGFHHIRKVTAGAGIITTMAGDGTEGYSGDGGPATSAQLDDPSGVAVDSAGNVYVADSVNNVIRMLVPEATHAVLSITSTHSANFAQGQTDAAYSVVVSNAPGAAPTSGTVTVSEALPAGLTLVSMSGAGWDCSAATCTRDGALDPGASYPPISVTVNVGADAPLQVIYQVTVSGGGSTAASATDLTMIGGAPAAPVLASPANTATGALLAPTLTWNASIGATSYQVYFGTLSTPPLVTSTTGTSYAATGLATNTTYYWQIVARNGFGSASSAIWSFTTTGAAATPLRFVAVTPCRVVDTRSAGGSLAARSSRSFAISQSGCGIPATAQAYSLNVTVVPAGPLSYLTLWPTGQPQPLVSTLNSFAGTVVANAAIVPAGAGGAVSAYVSDQSDVILDIDGYFDTAGTANSSSFYATTPCRLADTRGATGQFGGPALVAHLERDFPIPLSTCSIPATAKAYSLNVTAIPATNFLAYLTTWPTGSAQPQVSTLNSWTGKVVANAALVPAGSNGSVSVFVTDPANVILDVNGYFGQPGGAGELAFYPLAPCRVVDTRNADGAFGGPEMEAETTRSFALPAGGCSVPSTAAAYSLNVTVVPDGPLPFLTAWPAGAGRPLVSTLNSFDGSVVANAAIVPAGTNGAVSIYVTNRTQVILDINGYFAP